MNKSTRSKQTILYFLVHNEEAQQKQMLLHVSYAGVLMC